MLNITVDWRERRLIHNLYMAQRVKLRLNQGENDSVEIGGVRQGLRKKELLLCVCERIDIVFCLYLFLCYCFLFLLVPINYVIVEFWFCFYVLLLVLLMCKPFTVLMV